jgi:hypothetical protein
LLSARKLLAQIGAVRYLWRKPLRVKEKNMAEQEREREFASKKTSPQSRVIFLVIFLVVFLAPAMP